MVIKIKKRGQDSLKAGINAKSRQRRERLRDEVALRSQAIHLGRNDINPRLVLEERLVSGLRPANRRLRKSNATQVKQVARSMAAFGCCQPVLIDSSGRIVDGHIRWEAAESLGIDRVPCIIIDHLTEDEIRLLRLALYRLAENGEWDFEQLQLEVSDLGDLNLDLELTGFSDFELDLLIQEPVEVGASDNEAPEPEARAVSVVGDLWVLGNHRLFCGDATQKESYEMLMAGERAHMSFGERCRQQ